MINIQKKQNKSVINPKFSILLPTWNNLPYLQLAVKSIQKNAHFSHQIIVIINEGSDGTLEWVQGQAALDYVYAPQNIGICLGLNAARSLIRAEYVCYMNDDMYVCPAWDVPLVTEIEKINSSFFFLSATMIEPKDTHNPCVIVADFGDDISNFQEENLLKKYKNFEKNDWNGATWPPNVLHIDIWDLVGGMSVEYSPGMYSDPDLSMKLWQIGVRYFKGLGASRVYHFGSKSTKKIKHNKGKDTFLLKWGISSNDFTKKILRRGQPFEEGNSTIKTGFFEKIKQIKAIFRKK